jgi:hypothetical protein
MSDVIFNEFASAMAQKNTALHSTFARSGAKCFLLKRETQRKDFVELAELTTGYQIKYGQIRDDLYLFYSTTDDMSNIWAEMSFIAYGVPDDSNEMFVYEIQPEQKERVSPDIRSHEWKAFAVRKTNERYSLS